MSLSHCESRGIVKLNDVMVVLLLFVLLMVALVGERGLTAGRRYRIHRSRITGCSSTADSPYLPVYCMNSMASQEISRVSMYTKVELLQNDVRRFIFRRGTNYVHCVGKRSFSIEFPDLSHIAFLTIVDDLGLYYTPTCSTESPCLSSKVKDRASTAPER